jgi:ribosomal protein S10
VRGILWWKTRIWRLRRVRGNTAQGIYAVQRKDEEWSRIVHKRLIHNNAETGIREILRCKNKEHWEKCE